MSKNKRFIVNREKLPVGKMNGVDWFNTKEIEVYFIDDEKNYILKVEDVIKDENKIIKILLSYNNIKYKKYLQGGQVLNGNLEYVFSYYNIRGNKFRPYKLSNDGTYWIGIANTGEEFYFNGDNSEEIMKHSWRISNGYLTCTFTEDGIYKYLRLNRFVLGITDTNIIVNHYDGNKMDNRVEMLSLSDHEDNMKELLPSINNNTGITGLSFNEKNNTYKISCNVNRFSYVHVYDSKDEALIDLLIIQKHYEYRHNNNLYYMLDNISEEYINKLIEKVENKISTYKVNPIMCKNTFEPSSDVSFYYMYDKDNNRCKISIEDLDLVKQGNWHHTLNNGKEYFSGEIIWNGKRKGIYLHRFLFDLIDPKYRHWYIDHLDSDGLNNTRENLVITDAQGNGINKNRKDIKIEDNNTYRCKIVKNKKKYFKTFHTYEEAMKCRDEIIAELMKNRIEFKSREELDEYLKQ